jgi:hypothetical protein
MKTLAVFLVWPLLSGVVPLLGTMNVDRPPSQATTFRFEDRHKRETLRVVYLSPHAIRFSLAVTMKASGKTATLAGTAQMKTGDFDPEIDGDEQGTAYAVDEFKCGGDCGVSLRLDAEGWCRAKVYVSACPNPSGQPQPNRVFDCHQVMRVVK